MSHATVHNWESGKNTPNVAVLAALLTRSGENTEERQVFHDAINEMAGRHGAAGVGSFTEAADVFLQYRRGRGERSEEFIKEMETALKSGPEPQLLAVLRYYNEFRRDPDYGRAFFEAAAYLSVYAARAHNDREQTQPQSQFGELSEKELQRMENLLYFMRHADADEVDEMVRRAAMFRRYEEEGRKSTTKAKPARRERR